MKKKLSVLLALALVFTLFLGFGKPLLQNPATAALSISKVDFTDAKVTTDYLNVRQGPSTKYPIIWVLKKGETVKVLSKVGDYYAVYEPNRQYIGLAYTRYLNPIYPSSNTPKPSNPTPPTTTPKPSLPPKPAPTPSTPAPSTPTPSACCDISQDEQAVLNLVNNARANAGLSPLKFDMALEKMARVKANDMVQNNYFSHQSPTYGSPFDMMRQFGISFNTAGENIAGNSSIQGAFDAWMNSPGHKANILNASYNYTGIGIAPSSTYGKILAQDFIGR